MGYPTYQDINLEEIKEPGIYKFWVGLITDQLGMPMYLPVIIAKGSRPGKTLGITAAIHGNEINGIPIIHRLFRKINPMKLSGIIIGIPVVNIPAFLNKERRFVDDVDLNHIMPGIKDGNVSEVYAYRFFHKVIEPVDYLIDFHTASFGRINSYYIRADMDDKITAEMTHLMNAQIVVHNPPYDGTLRGAASAIGIPSITLELGNPNIFQRRIIIKAYQGLKNVLSYLGFVETPIEEYGNKTIYCTESEWIYTDKGGILRVLPRVIDIVRQGDEIANIQDIFGENIHRYYAPYDGVVIGKSTSPINQTGGRILHIGKIKPNE